MGVSHEFRRRSAVPPGRGGLQLGVGDVVGAVADGVAKRFPAAVLNLCGKTGLPELAGLLSRCRAVCCNDSGGMHLATAVGAPVVAVFGLTDPGKTGPLGRSAVVAAEGVKVSRSIPRESEAATRALASVQPERVFAALRQIADQ